MKDTEKKPLHWTQIAERIVLSAFSFFLLYYAISSLAKGVIYMPSGRASSRGFYLYGASAWFMAGAMICCAASASYHVIRRLGRPYERKRYRFLRLSIRAAGWTLFVAALVVGLLSSGTR
jgi:uncharacterized membrane protein